ncbi:hypothetical protein [Mesorhizobium sp. B2-1-3]|uniref:hypothetical protein n=1 Tax=Mesorhizobium sp. B2-1-3 TaxID=2589972 RepID=UPI001FED7E98|nr:hypothetical protein [Mesorhizobium sp. B2-1-3]
MANLSDRERSVRQRLKNEFSHYAERCLHIRAKDGKIVPLSINEAQRYLHSRLEDQKARTGKVRALVLKGRQQGISTYVGGRFYHRVTHNKGLRCFILTHEQDATNNLFGMVDRYHQHCPPLVKPSTGAANAKELFFDRLESGYAVGTAGAKATGRSQTVQLFHGSEVAFWPNASTHFAGVVQAIPDLPGTEIILESTANGMGGEFHERWQQAEAGVGDYEAIFIPWFWQAEYRRNVPEGFELNDEEREYRAAYDLDLEQMVWRRNKIAELKDPLLFKQEYPATAAEAFQMSGHDSYIPASLILKARKTEAAESGPLVIGYDPNWKGKDRASLARRRGRKVLKVESRQGLDTMGQVGWLKQVIDAEKPARVFIDVGGVGAGVYDRLCEMGYGDIVVAINFGSSPLEPQPLDEGGRPKGGYLNRRAEMWGKSKDWLEEPAGVDIPDSDAIQADACAPGYKYDSLTRLVLESKDDIRKRGLRSPDEWDAVALTFAEPVVEPKPRPVVQHGPGGWMG